MLNDLDRKILNILIEERRPVSSKGLALRCDASINTVRKEISLINEEMSCYGFRIESKSALGHYLNIFDRKLAEPYIQKQHNLYKRNARVVGGKCAVSDTKIFMQQYCFWCR